jgi:aminodeoxychorismate lyase
MNVVVNGQFVAAEDALVSAFDRGFLLGDGLFETIRVLHGSPFGWDQHLARLCEGARFLKISLPFTPDALHRVAVRLVAANQVPDGLLRITLTRGPGPRGYSPQGAVHPTTILALHPAPPTPTAANTARSLITSSVRIPTGDPLARFKTCNKLPQILARMEADAAGADDALLANTDGYLVEASGSNLFWIHHGIVHTPPLAAGILPGVTRAILLELLPNLSLPVRETSPTREQLLRADGVFLSSSALGVAAARSLDDQPFAPSALVEKISRSYVALLEARTRQPG